MKKVTILLVTVLITSIAVNAQKKKDPKYEHHFKNPSAISTDEYKLEFFDVQSQAEFCKLAVKITNNTNDFLIFDKGVSVFNFDFGQFSAKKKEILIKPNDSKKKVLQADGNNQFQVDKFSIDFAGFSLVPVKGIVSEMEDFQVPASKNSISSDLFDVKLNPKKTSLKTQGSVLQFECTYKGNEIGLLDPSKIVIKVDGTDKEYANDNTKSEIIMMKKGDKVKFKASFHIPGRIADMQFANMTISWKDTFVETKVKKLDGAKVNFEIDPGMTNGKN
jgi:hypothetical protein